MSFILDALRKSEHDRQRSAVPGLSQVPLATPRPQMPRWALAVIGVLVGAVLLLGGAWWQSARVPTPAEPAASAPTVERDVELPRPSPRTTAPQQAAPARLPSPEDSSLSAAAASSSGGVEAGAGAAGTTAGSTQPRVVELSLPRPESPGGAPTFPSPAALAAEGVVVPPLRLELHAFSSRPRDRFVYINGRKYVEGDRLAEGPLLVAIEPTGAVLSHAGRRFMIVQE